MTANPNQPAPGRDGGGDTGRVPVHAFDRPFGRLKAWMDMLLVDHGVLRLGWRHWHHVKNEIYRSNQPAPFHIRRAARFGIRTIINLRGANDSGHYHLEREAAEKAGLTLIDFPIKSRRAPPKEMVLQALDLFGRLETPALVHCKSGIDRAGLMSALYILASGGSAEEALGQFARRYGYLGNGPTGIGKAFVQAFQRAAAEGETDFAAWVRDSYDPDALTASFRAKPFSTALANYVLRRE